MFLKSIKKINQNLLINFGPQHPAAHGVLRLVLALDGELVKNADPHIGFLHRGTEKLIETKTYLQAIPYFDRLDYVSTMTQEHSYVLGVETLLNLKVPKKAQFIRVIFAELTRILNHLMSILTHALDIGALTPFLWGFEEREKILEFYERVSGARMHTAFFRIGGVKNDLTENLKKEIYKFSNQFEFRISEIEEILSNSIWYGRLVNVGIVSMESSIDLGFSGPMIRGSGIPWDLRKVQPYEIYKQCPLNISIGTEGDCYSRYLVRINEMKNSIKLIRYCLDNMPQGNIMSTNKKFAINKSSKHTSMESLIQHFNYYSKGIFVPKGQVYGYLEAPKGELGVYLVSIGENKPYRCKIKSPGFVHLQSINFMAKDHFLADLVTIIGTQDIVFGEIDR